MMPGSKGLNPHELAHRWMKDLGTRPDMEQNIQWMFVLHRPKRSVDIKVERQLHDMRILGRVLCASGTRLAPTEVATEMWGAVCQWHTFSTDRSEHEDTKYGTIRKASFDPNIFWRNYHKHFY